MTKNFIVTAHDFYQFFSVALFKAAE